MSALGEQLTLLTQDVEPHTQRVLELEHAPSRMLTEQQESAVVQRQGSLLLAAGAGSGKTAVLVERFVRAVLADGIAPARILAITFTDRAAGELTQRLRQRFLELGERTHARDVEAAFVGTFHTFCARLLRLHALAAGVPPDFKVLEEAQGARLRDAAFAEALVEMVRCEGDAGVELLAAYGDSRLREMVLGVHAELRSRGEQAPRLPADCVRAGGSAEEHARATCALLDGLLAGFSRKYEQLKRVRGALDFDDLELHARGLLATDEPVRESWRDRFELLMVDELQDVNPRQLALLRALERENLFTVGDELQSIYGFRHADVELFRTRRGELAEVGRALELTYNFRARPELLDAVNAVFVPRFGERYAPLRAGREGEGGVAPAVELLLSDREWDRHEELGEPLGEWGEARGSRRAEAQMLAQRIADLIAAGDARARDIAVLVRARTGLDVYARALEEHGVPALASVGGFWGHQQVRDLVSYLRVLANPRDERALYGVLASPFAGLSRDGLGLIARARKERGTTAWEAARRLAAGEGELGSEDRTALEGICGLIERERRESAWVGPAGALRRVLAASGYERGVLTKSAPERRIANIRKLIRVASRFERDESGDLRGFVDYATHAEQARGHSEPHAPVADEELEAVRLMTIHAAKGLEFPVVCVPELGARPNLRMADLLVDGERVGIRLVELGNPESVHALEFDELSAQRKRAQEEEEDRILYVALTRARERLLLSGVVSFKRWPEAKMGCAPIEWLAPALVEDVAARVAQAGEGEPVWVAHGAAGAVRCWLNSPPTLGRALREGSLRAIARALEAPRVVAEMQPAASVEPVKVREGIALPAALSYTALTQLERCGYRYYLEHELRLPETGALAGGRRDGAGRARGRVLHRLLERFDFGGEGAVAVGDVRRAERELGESLSERERRGVAQVLSGLRGSELARRLGASEVHREQPFAFVFDPSQPMVSGVIDALCKEREGSYLVVDYKSDTVGEDEDLDALVEELYGVQRLVYALAAFHDGAREVEVVHWFLARAEVAVYASFDAAQRSALEGELRRRIEAVRSGGYEVSAEPHRELCAGCPGRGTLCSWSAEQTRRPRRP